jgi:peroxiredoxin
MRRTLAILSALALAATLSAQAPKMSGSKMSGSKMSSSKMSAAPKAAPKTPSVTPRPAGEFVIHMIDGSNKLLSSYRGKFVVMAFMFTTCTHCQHTAGVLSKIQNEYASKGVQMLGVTIDPGAKVQIPAFLKITGANFPVGYSDEQTALKFLHGPTEGWYVPMLAFIDQKGTVRSQYIVTDPGDDASKWLEDQDGDGKANKGSIRREIDKYLKTSASAKK